jgi:hypothetical protein
VVVDDFNGFRARIRPNKTETELVVDADAVLAGSITAQQFQTVARRDAEVIEAPSDVQLPELAACHALKRLELRH